MSVINTNVASLIAQRALQQNNQALNTSLQRLSTGLKINSGADDPAGLIASQNLKAEQTGISTAIDNANQANNVIGTAEGGLSEVSSLLVQLQGLVSQAANTGGLSAAETGADQLQVDSILNTINRIANSTTFQGTQLLNGALAYTTSGISNTAVANVEVNSALVPSGGSVAVNVQVVASAATGQITYTGGAVGHGGVTLEVSGNLGTQQLSFASGTAVSAIAAAINGISTSTGLSAAIVNSDLQVNSTSFGSGQFVAIQAITGTFSGLSSNTSYGADAKVNINGAQAEVAGLDVNYRTGALDVSLTLQKTFNKPGTTSFNITGGGATFALGDKVTTTNKASIGIGSVATGNLGDSINGYLNSLGTGGANSLTSGNLPTSQVILANSISQVSNLRGRLGAFQDYTIGSTINDLSVAYENASAADSNIEDTNFAAETSNLTRAQILTQAASTVLAQANTTPQQALTLLRGG
jgi:flagellin